MLYLTITIQYRIENIITSMSDKVRKSPGRPRSLKSHQAILQATLKLLSEVGYERMSIDAIAASAGVGKTTIYRRYKSKAELVGDAIESLREEVIIPDTGSLWTDIDALIATAAQMTLNALGRQTVAMIIATASNNPEFAQIYSTKFLQPRRKAFAIVMKRAKARNEIQTNVDSNLIFDTMSAMMLYALIFPPNNQSWENYVRSALQVILKN